MKEIAADKDLVACCGLYCGACGAYLKGRCPGCRENSKACVLKIRELGLEGYAAFMAQRKRQTLPRRER